MILLTLLRHAKAEATGPGIDDKGRKLSERGRADAAVMGRHLAERGVRPDLILCSDAARTRETCEIVAPLVLAGAKAKTVFEAGLYLADAYELIDRVLKIGPPARHAMIIGHNPGLHDLALDYTEGLRSPEITALKSKFPTGAAITLSFAKATHWSKIKRGTADIDLFVTPRGLKKA